MLLPCHIPTTAPESGFYPFYSLSFLKKTQQTIIAWKSVNSAPLLLLAPPGIPRRIQKHRSALGSVIYLESQVAQNTRPLYTKVAAHNFKLELSKYSISFFRIQKWGSTFRILPGAMGVGGCCHFEIHLLAMSRWAVSCRYLESK